MLEYTKTILTKLSFNEELFRKELKKSLNYLNPIEIKTLRAWLESNFSNVHFESVYNTFSQQESYA